MTENPITIAPLSGSPGLFSDSSIISDVVVSSKSTRLKASNHFDDKTSESDVCADAISKKGNNSIHEDVKVSQGVNIIVAQDKMKDATADSTSHNHCVLRLIPYYILKEKDPILAAVVVIEGTTKIGTPLCIPSRDHIYIGRITSIFYRDGYTPLTSVREGEEAIIKIECEGDGEQPNMPRMHAQMEDFLVSWNEELN